MTSEEQFVDAVLRAWKSNVDRVEALFANRSDEELETRVAAGRNRLVYLLGHLVAVHDRMIPLLGIGDRKHADLDAVFLENADSGAASSIAPAELKQMLVETNRVLSDAFSAWSTSDWLARHTAVSEEDFRKEPHRNRLSVVLSRNSHLAFHHGQMVLTQPRR